MSDTQESAMTRAADRLARILQRSRALFLSKHVRAGFTYAEHLATSELPAAPDEPGALESYFDAHTEGPGIWKWRHYFPVYERYFERFVSRPVEMVEIGVFSGGSLDMWRSYFGEQSQIYGVDIEPSCRAYEGPGKRIFIGDQSDPAFWQQFLREVPQFDIVIDDGGHQPHQQIVTLEALLPHIRPGGVYVCEDALGLSNAFHAYVHGLSLNLHTYSPNRDEGIPANELQRSIEAVHIYPYVVVIEKKAAAMDRLVLAKRGTEWQPSIYRRDSFPTAEETTQVN